MRVPREKGVCLRSLRARQEGSLGPHQSVLLTATTVWSKTQKTPPVPAPMPGAL